MSQTVERAIAIMELTSAAPRTLTEVAEHLGVHRTTALRLLRTLTDGGITRRRDDGRYGIGYRLAGLASLANDQFDLRNLAHDHLVRLSQLSGHTIHLAAIEGDDIIYIDIVDRIGGLSLYARVGRPVRLHTAAVGKAVLSQQSEDIISAMLLRCDFEQFTQSTIATPDALMSELRVARERGWATDNGEMEAYLNCIGAPIRQSSGAVVAAVSVTALKVKADLAKLESEMLPHLLQTCNDLSKDLGWLT